MSMSHRAGERRDDEMEASLAACVLPNGPIKPREDGTLLVTEAIPANVKGLLAAQAEVQALSDHDVQVQLLAQRKRVDAVLASRRELMHTPQGLRSLFPTNLSTVRIKKVLPKEKR